MLGLSQLFPDKTVKGFGVYEQLKLNILDAKGDKQEINPYAIYVNNRSNGMVAELFVNGKYQPKTIGIHNNKEKFLITSQVSLDLKDTPDAMYFDLFRSQHYVKPYGSNDLVQLLTYKYKPLALVTDTEEGPAMFTIGLIDGKPAIIYLSKNPYSKLPNAGAFFGTKQLEAFQEFHKNSFGVENKVSQSMVGLSLPNMGGKNTPTIITKHYDYKKPRSIVDHLDEYVIGQDKAKKSLATFVKKNLAMMYNPDSEIKKSNALVIGPSGSGKTFLMYKLFMDFGVPVVYTTATAKTQSGYIGENLREAIVRQIMNQLDKESIKGGYVEPSGFVFIDEFDKLASDRKSNGDQYKKLQQELVGMVEETNLTQSLNHQTESITINTKNLVFIGAGAYMDVDQSSVSITDVVRDRLYGNQSTMGFNSVHDTIEKITENELRRKVTSDDLETFGFMPELVGRFPSRIILDSLNRDELALIAQGTKGSDIISNKEILKFDGYDVKIDKEIPFMIADICLGKKTGARAMDNITSELFDELIYDSAHYANRKNVIHITPELFSDLVLDRSK